MRTCPSRKNQTSRKTPTWESVVITHIALTLGLLTGGWLGAPRELIGAMLMIVIMSIRKHHYGEVRGRLENHP